MNSSNKSIPIVPAVRKGQSPGHVSRSIFHARFMAPFADPAFHVEAQALERLEEIAWEAYEDGRKAPDTRPIGEGFADPTYEVAVEWFDASRRLREAQTAWSLAETRSRVLLVNGSPRNDGTCPGEISKTYRMTQLAQTELEAVGIEFDVLDLSLLTSEYGRHIHPCKGCVSTAMPLCHWPCSCYPNHSLNQTNDWMNDIYERWVAAHGVILFTPTHWYQAPAVLKLMIDRLVCADGGNPDPSSTHGKKPEEAKALELEGWGYPKHLEGRVYGVVVHGDVAGIEGLRRDLSDWLDWMGMIDAGKQGKLDRYIGYYQPYATSHDELDADEKMQEEVRIVARAMASGVAALRSGRLKRVDGGQEPARAK